MAQWLMALDALVEDLDLVPSFHKATYDCSLHFDLGHLKSSSGMFGYLVQIHVCGQTHA